MATETPIAVPDGGVRSFAESRIVQNGENEIRVFVRNAGDRGFRIGRPEVVSVSGDGISDASFLGEPPVERLLAPDEMVEFVLALDFAADGSFAVGFRIPASPFFDGFYEATVQGTILYEAIETAILVTAGPLNFGTLGFDTVKLPAPGKKEVVVFPEPPHAPWLTFSDGEFDTVKLPGFGSFTPKQLKASVAGPFNFGTQDFDQVLLPAPGKKTEAAIRATLAGPFNFGSSDFDQVLLPGFGNAGGTLGNSTVRGPVEFGSSDFDQVKLPLYA